jgi:ribulose-5-phosphate 4-epimerase/fuculose-1-phosphate aldolase
MTTKEIAELLQNDVARLRAKSLFGERGDSVSMRIPGRTEFLLALPDNEGFRTVGFGEKGDEAAAFHAAIYRARQDAGAILIGRTPWSAAISTIGTAVPTLFDEQARHIGKMEDPVHVGRRKWAIEALRGGGNAALYGDQRICVGTTPDRIVFNADLFEKCAKAFVIAHASGYRIRKVPGWVRYIAGRRLKKDQKRAAESYHAGQIPEGMDAY